MWVIVSVAIFGLYCLFMLYPILKMLIQSVFDNETGAFTFKYFTKFFSDSYYFSTLLNSFRVSIWATAITLVIGVPLAYLYNMYEIKGRNFLQILIILCSMSAPFLGAYAWVLLLGRGGVITKVLNALLGIQLPSIYGFSGILLVLSTKLFPLVFLYVSGALKNVDNSLLEASSNMGCKGVKRLFKVIIPLCMPSILASALMVFMRSLADFGTPLMIGEGYRTFPIEIYKQYVGEAGTNYNFAAAVSVIAVLITAVIFLLQKYTSNKYSFTMNAMHTIERKKPGKVAGVLIHLYCYGLVAISFMPQLYLIYCSFRNTSKTGNMFKPGFSLMNYQAVASTLNTSIWNTVRICGGALIIIVIMAMMISYLVVRRRNVLNGLIDTVSMVPYIIPGSVIGIAMVMGFSSGAIVLTGTAWIIVIAMCIRRMPYTIRSSVAVLQQIPRSVEEASASLGASKLKTFCGITIPMMFNGVIAGAIMSWVTLITELSSSIILYSSKTLTLNLSVYVMVQRGTDGKACAISTILTLFTVLTLALYMKLSKSKEISM
ncbi:MAG: iron ABC transporter permease [Candidatus Limiplasma sp.]|nr:iron ABC transporter permease [Candidatus Limiplasma sp.]